MVVRKNNIQSIYKTYNNVYTFVKQGGKFFRDTVYIILRVFPFFAAVVQFSTVLSSFCAENYASAI